MFVVVPDHVSKENCSYLIDIFKNLYKDRGLPWRDTVRLNLADYGEPDRDEFINYLSELFCQYFQNYIEMIEVVQWPEHSYMKEHFDTARESTTRASITYLNDDYEGGQTCVSSEKFCVNPKVGTTVFFDGQKYKHCVKEVKNGTRYTLAIWYTNDINLKII